MPIDYTNYPPNWQTEIRPRILARAKHCCEFCQVPNYKEVVRDNTGKWHDAYEFFDAYETESDTALDRKYPGWDEKEGETFKPIKIVLTIMHLDHDPENWQVKDDRLAAGCQRCHLRYDAPEKAKRRRIKKYSSTLFPIQ